MEQMSRAQEQMSSNIRYLKHKYHGQLSSKKIEKAFRKQRSKKYIHAHMDIPDQIISEMQNQKQINSYTFDIRKTGLKKINIKQFLVNMQWSYASTVNFSHCQLGNEGWNTIIEYLQKFKQLKQLNLINNYIRVITQNDLEKLIKLSIQTLDLRKNYIDWKLVEIIDKFRIQNPQLVILSDHHKQKAELIRLYQDQNSELQSQSEEQNLMIQEKPIGDQQAQQTIFKEYESNRKYLDEYFNLSSQTHPLLKYAQNTLIDWKKPRHNKKVQKGLTKYGYRLAITQLKFDLKDLIKNLQWNYIQTISFQQCRFTDQDWELLIENAKLFKNLQVLMLGSTNITHIKPGQLELFQSLRKLSLYMNPLDTQTLAVLKQYKKIYGDQNIHI